MTTTYLLNQRFRYDYAGPIEDLRHRLIVIPQRRHGDQRRVEYRLEVRGADAVVTERRDGFGNHRYEVMSQAVDATVEFESWVIVENGAADRPVAVGARALTDARLCRSSRLTRTDDALAAAAGELAAPRGGAMAVAERITTWVHGALRYQAGSTHVHTTAAEALAGGYGVCQDYAHVMLAVAREAGLAARYVSGHLAGEGGSHAWVEVIVPDKSNPGRARAVAFDPTNDRRAGDQYVTVAVGRDYRDVPPTSGTFRAGLRGLNAVAGCSGKLSASKRMERGIADLASAMA